MAFKLFVGSLPANCDNETFNSLFTDFGTVVNSYCAADKRYGFVTYETQEEAEAAIAAVNGFDLNGATLVVKHAESKAAGGGKGAGSFGAAIPTGLVVPPPSQAPGSQGGDRIYVKGLPAGYNEMNVREAFTPYGSVMDTKVLVSDGEHSDGEGQTVAIVRMGSASEATWLVNNLNGNIPQGHTRAVEVTYAGAPKGQSKGLVVPPPPAVRPAGPYGGGYGAGGGYSVPPPPFKGGGKGWSVPPPAQQANGAWSGGGAPAGGAGKGGGGPGTDALVPGIQEMLAQVTEGSKLYIKGLPPHGDDLYLYKAFAPFGAILSAKVIYKDNYSIGFVTYASDAEAAAAIQSLHGNALTDGTALQVQVKVAKGAAMG